MRKGRPLTPAEERAQAEYEAWHEAKMQDLADKEQERREAPRKGVLVSNTADRFEYEWSQTTTYGEEQLCLLRAYFFHEKLFLQASHGWGTGATVPEEPARLLTTWLIERDYGPKGGAACST